MSAADIEWLREHEGTWRMRMKMPEDIHRNEQLVAAMGDIASALAKMYHELRTQGVPGKDATAIVTAYAQGWAASIGGK